MEALYIVLGASLAMLSQWLLNLRQMSIENKKAELMIQEELRLFSGFIEDTLQNKTSNEIKASAINLWFKKNSPIVIFDKDYIFKTNLKKINNIYRVQSCIATIEIGLTIYRNTSKTKATEQDNIKSLLRAAKLFVETSQEYIS